MFNLKEQIEKKIEQINREGLPDFLDYSPAEMAIIIDNPVGERCPIQLNHLEEDDYRAIPLLQLFKSLATLVAEEGEIKLTARGNLPPVLVKKLYAQAFIPDYAIEAGITKLTNEQDVDSVHLTHILLLQAGIVKKRRNRLSLTKSGKAFFRKNDDSWLGLLMDTFWKKFNWAYFDGFGENDIGQKGFGFSLILLHKFGQEKRPDHFYAEKYFTAFPILLDPKRNDLPEMADICYSIRTFDRFLAYFGLTESFREKRMGAAKYVWTTTLFQKLIQIIPPQSQMQD